MASRGGRMVDGTDGTDHQFREKVASQYKVSATNKSRMRFLLICHWVLALLHLLRVSPKGLLPIDPLPEVTWVDYLWLLTLPFTIIAMLSSRKSKTTGLDVFRIAVLAFGICPLTLVLYQWSPDVLQYLQYTDTTGLFLWNGIPFGLLWSSICANCILIHMAEIKVASVLLEAFAPRHGKKAH